MKISIAAIALIAAALFAPRFPASAQAAKEEALPPAILAGYDAGLYRVERDGERAVPLWLDGEVRKIVKTGGGWFLLSSRGIVWSRDLGAFESRNTGLPVKTYKRYEGGRRSFLTEAQDLKDLEADLSDPLLLVACTKDAVFLTRDAGLSWASLGAPVATPGLKAVALAPHPGDGEAAVWASHPIKGLFVRKLAPSSSWTQVGGGLATLPGSSSADEVSDIIPAPASGGLQALWAANSFLPRLYKWNLASKSFDAAWKEEADFGCVESLDPLPDGGIRFVTEGEVRRLGPESAIASADPAAMAVVRSAIAAKPDWQLLSVSWAEGGRQASLNELWLVEPRNRKPFRAVAENRLGLYLITGYVVNQASRDKYDAVMDDRGLDSVVVDMKDDYGRLRFEPRDPLIRRIGKSSNPLDVEGFVREWKAKGRYLIARIPVFKDEVAYESRGGVYAVWDAAAKAPWRGYNTEVTVPEAPPPVARPDFSSIGPSTRLTTPASPPEPRRERRLIDEYWVDPYCEEIWAYNVAIANEIVARGFDEVQFDYIRFPTDGENVDAASYRWRDPGMDKESALASFLRFARENIAAPISIDIYGANGWYRSGVRTGQDVELLVKYVDVICPMFYPSHFEQGFLAQAPAEDRPYRIYKMGVLRNAFIARKKVVIRPYVQAFFLNVSYDRAYYGPDYVRREVEGVRDAMNAGLTFWNNAGRYDDLPVLRADPAGKLMAEGSTGRPAQ